jgi:tetratricopeptide (TPR) repeat protein
MTCCWVGWCSRWLLSGDSKPIENRSRTGRNGYNTQFELGVADMDAGRYEMARKRFEYVIEINPNFPGIEEKLAGLC